METPDQFFRVAAFKVGDHSFHLDVGIDQLQLPFGGDGFGEIIRGVGFVEEDLALQVARFDKVAVHDAKPPDSRARQGVRLGGPEGSAAHDNHFRLPQFFLPSRCNRLEEYLARVFFSAHHAALDAAL